MPNPDVTVTPLGVMLLFEAHHKTVWTWIAANVHLEDWAWYGHYTFVTDPQKGAEVITALREAGFTVESSTENGV